MNWETLRADEYCIAVKDGTHDTPKPVDFGYKLVTGKHVKNGQIDSSSAYYISEEDYNAINKRSMVERWDVIMSMIGTVGEAAVVKNDPDYAIKNVALFKCGGSEVRGKWLCYYLNSPEGKGKMLGEMKGSSQQFLSLKQLRELPIMFSEEKVPRIVEIISNYDDLIENNQKQIKLLEEAAQRLYKEWFVDLHFPGHENTKIVDGVPEGWSKSTVSEVSAVLRRGISPKYNEKARGIVINQKCIRQTIVSYDEARTQEKKYPAELEMMESDIVICSTGAGTLGRVGQIFEAKGNATLDSHVTLIRANERVGQQYLFWSLKMQQDYLMSAGKGSTNQLELSRETIGNCKILMPEQKIAEQAEKNFVAIHNKMKECSMQIARLREARNLLLPKLMSGEVEV